jgi:uncharacterized membrane protein YqhA
MSTSTKPTNKRPQSFLAFIIGSTRYVMIVAVAGIFLGSTALLISGTFDIIRAVWEIIAGVVPYESTELRITLIEAVDTVLVATVLYMIAIGLYQLFVAPTLVLPAWLQTRGLNDLEKRLAGMVVTVLGVIFVTVALESHGNKDILGFGLAIASVIAAISLFLYQEGKFHQSNHSNDED